MHFVRKSFWHPDTIGIPHIIERESINWMPLWERHLTSLLRFSDPELDYKDVYTEFGFSIEEKFDNSSFFKNIWVRIKTRFFRELTYSSFLDCFSFFDLAKSYEGKSLINSL